MESSPLESSGNSETPPSDPPLAEKPSAVVESFDELVSDPGLREALKRNKFTKPTPVQAAVLPIASSGQDLIVQARTGSGKTLAFSIPLLEKIRALSEAGEKRETQALVITPTRELAFQIREVIQSVSPDSKPVLIIGGTEFSTQERELKNDPRIVVGTPGRILDLMRQKILKLSACRFFVLDEADETLSMGFLQDIRAILSRLPDERQGIFTSATITPRVEMLANSFLEKHERVSVDSTYTDLPSITHYYCEVGSELMAKPAVLCDLIETQRPTSAIIFCNTKSDTALVELLLRKRGFDARRLNSDLSQSQRTAVMKRLRNRDLQFLVATDLAARGIDIEQIDVVINYAASDQPEVYVHRTGRTGRAGRIGRAISLVAPRDFLNFHAIRKSMSVEFHQMTPPTDDEVAEARLLHLHEIIRHSKLAPSERDLLTAKKLLKEQVGDITLPEEFELLFSKLCRHLVENHVAPDAKSLEEELPAEDGERAPERESRGRDDSRGPRRDDRRDGSRNERRDGDRRSGDRRESRGDDRREPRGEGRGENRGETRQEGRGDERRERRAPPRAEEGRREERPRDASREGRESGPHIPHHADVRLYIGQGTKQGMDEEHFRELLTDFAEVEPSEVRYIVFREDSGFFDISGSRVKKVLETLNGIEYNGASLPVEIAAVMKSNREDNRGERQGGRGGDRRGYGRRDDRRDDRRGGGGRGGDRRGRDY